MNKYLLAFIGISFPAMIWGISPVTKTYPDDMFVNVNPGSSLNGFYSDLLAEQKQSIPTGNVNSSVAQRVLYWNKVVPKGDAGLATKVENLINASRVALGGSDPVISEVVTEKDIQYLILVSVGSILDLQDISALCSLGVTQRTDDDTKLGFSYTDLFSNQEQLTFSSQIKQFCEEEEGFLQLEKEISIEAGIEGLFNDTRTDNSPFEVTAPIAEIDANLHGPFASGGSVAKEGGENEELIPSAYPLVSWSDKNIAFDPVTRLPFSLNPFADPSAPAKESDNESIQLLPDLPPSFLAQKNTADGYQDSRELSTSGCHKLLNGECDKKVNPHAKTENAPETKDVSWMGMFGRMKERFSTMNNHALSGGVAGKSFGELTYPQIGGNKQFLSHDAGETINVHNSSYAESESSNASLEAQVADIVSPYDVTIEQVLTQTPCSQYKPLRADTRSALQEISICSQRRESELQKHLTGLQQNYKQNAIQQGIEKKLADNEQLNTELESLQKRMEEIQNLFKDLNSKKRIS